MRLLLVGLLFATSAAAQSLPPPGSFEVVIDRQLNAPPAVVYDWFVHVERWWSASHTYSGDAANLSLEARAGFVTGFAPAGATPAR